MTILKNSYNSGRFAHPPLQVEGRTTDSGPGWGNGLSSYLELLSPPSGALRAPTSPLQGEVVRS